MKTSDKVRAILKARGLKQSEFAEVLGVSQPTVARWLAGADPEFSRRQVIDEMYDGFEALSTESIPLMGYIGAGSEIEPEFEQTPADGFDQIEVPFPLPAAMVAFQVRGVSMLPVYRDGAIVICYREQKRPLEAFYGEDAAVKTSDGRRFLKTIMRGAQGVNLMSFNAAPIEDVALDWIGEIFAILPKSTVATYSKNLPLR